MNGSSLAINWASLVKDIQKWESWTLEDLARESFYSPEVVHQWTNESLEPNEEHKERIDKIAQALSIKSLGGYVELVKESPFPIFIVDQRDNVLVASRASRLASGVKLIKQLTDYDAEMYIKYLEQLSGSGFWQRGGQKHNFRIQSRTRLVEVVVTSISVSTGVYLVAQRKLL